MKGRTKLKIKKDNLVIFEGFMSELTHVRVNNPFAFLQGYICSAGTYTVTVNDDFYKEVHKFKVLPSEIVDEEFELNGDKLTLPCYFKGATLSEAIYEGLSRHLRMPNRHTSIMLIKHRGKTLLMRGSTCSVALKPFEKGKVIRVGNNMAIVARYDGEQVYGSEINFIEGNYEIDEIVEMSM